MVSLPSPASSSRVEGHAGCITAPRNDLLRSLERTLTRLEDLRLAEVDVHVDTVWAVVIQSLHNLKSSRFFGPRSRIVNLVALRSVSTPSSICMRQISSLKALDSSRKSAANHFRGGVTRPAVFLFYSIPTVFPREECCRKSETGTFDKRKNVCVHVTGGSWRFCLVFPTPSGA